MQRLLVATFIVFLGLTLVPSAAWAQATAQISGTVSDPTGALIPGADVTVTQTATGIRRATVTNETGSYVFPALPVGPYRLEATLPGFQTFAQTGIVLQVGAAPVINIRLALGQVTQTVEVQANAALVETRTTAVGQVIDNEQILELPLNGRNVTDLIALSGAAVQVGVGGGAGGFRGDSTARISVAGGLSFGVSYSLDGAMHSDMYNGANHPMPFPDALQEFKVESSGSSTGSGMRSGGGVSAVTKSGTNQFHGDGFWFVRNGDFNGRNYFADERDTLKRNQFGGTIGGPIVSDKLFFFGGVQRTTTRSDPSAEQAFVPTAAVLSGDFSAFNSSACGGGGPLSFVRNGVQLFNNDVIDPAEFSPAAVGVASFLPSTGDPCGELRFGIIEKIDENQFVTKVDYQLTDNHSIFGRWIGSTYDLPPARSLSDNVLTSPGHGRDLFAQAYAFGSTYLVSPNTVNGFRMTVNRTAHHRFHADNFSVEDVGVNAYTRWGTASGRRRIDVEVDDGFELGGNSEGTFMTTAYQVSNDVNLIRGNHQIGIGFVGAHWRTVQNAATRAVGIYTFGSGATGLGMADFLLGRLETLEAGTDTAWASRNDYFMMYGSDVWQVSPNLTLNYGLRWEPFFSLEQDLGVPYQFDLDRFDQGIRSTQWPAAPVGMLFAGDAGFSESGGPMDNKYDIFNARVGLAWDITGDGRTSLRASAGTASDFPVSALFGGGASAPPWGFRTFEDDPSGGFDNPWSDRVGGDPLPVPHGSGQFPEFSIYAAFAEKQMKPPVVQSWNLSLQREISSDWIASASYIGSASIHQWGLRAYNNAVYFPGRADANGQCTADSVVRANGSVVNNLVLSGLRSGATCSSSRNTDDRRILNLLNPVDGRLMAVVNQREDGGTGSYHGMLLSVQRRAAEGINIGVNYTLSHCIGLARIFATNEGGEYVKPNDRNFDMGDCDSDRRHLFNLSSVASTPEFSSPGLRTLLGGWQLSTILRLSSGSPLLLENRNDPGLIGDARRGVQRPAYLGGNPIVNDGLTYLNADAFERVDRALGPGQFSDLGPHNLAGPGTWGLDLKVSRRFAVSETQSLEFRAEAFNATNSTRLNNPSVRVRQRSFGTITSARDPRIMQFALKYVF